ncbi:MAG TPA: hypothetical protein EYP81_01980 [Thermodesulfobacteriaceae bacterium]|nr:hypothetical protein [Thermodesulfobacteriaceae bacterium]
MRKYLPVMALLGLLIFFSPVKAEVLSVEEKEIYALYIVPASETFPTELGYIITNFGPGNIKFLDRIDIIVDREGRVQGLKIVYTPPDGFKRHVFLAGNRSLVVQEARPGSLKKKILFRVVTSDEINKLE